MKSNLINLSFKCVVVAFQASLRIFTFTCVWQNRLAFWAHFFANACTLLQVECVASSAALQITAINLINIVFYRFTFTRLHIELIKLRARQVANFLPNTVAIICVPNKASLTLISTFTVTLLEGITSLSLIRAATKWIANILETRCRIFYFCAVLAREVDMLTPAGQFITFPPEWTGLC